MSQEIFEQLVQDAEVTRVNHPFCITSYHKLKEYARVNSFLDNAEFLRMKFLHETYDVDHIKKWARVIEVENSEESANSLKREMYKTIVGEFPVVKHFSQWLNSYNCSLIDLKEAFMKTKYDFHNGQSIFERFLNEVSVQANDLSVRALYEARIATPHRQIQDTYDAFSAFVSNKFPDEYTSIMRGASKTMQITQRSQRYYEMLEQDISVDSDSHEPWIKYMDQLFAYTPKTEPFPAFLTIFYRSLFAGSKCKAGNESWLPVWFKAANYVQESDNIDDLYRASFFRLFLNLYPKIARVYSEVVYFITSECDLLDLRKRAIYEGIFNDNGADNATMAKDFLTLGWMMMGVNNNTRIEMWTDIETTQQAFSNNDEIFRFCVKLVENANHDKDKKQIERMTRLYVEKNSKRGTAWLSAFEVLESNSLKTELTNLVSDAMSKLSEFDDLQHIQTILARYEMLHRLSITHENIHEVKITTQRLNENISKIRKELHSREEQKQHQLDSSLPKVRNIEGTDSTDTQSRKRAKFEVHEKSETTHEPVRNREQFRVKLFPLNENVGDAEIRHFLKGYAEPVSIAFAEETDRSVGRFAIIELHSEQEVLSCLTRQFKPLGGTAANISRVFGTTVWAANYPSHYSITEIRSMIEEVSGKKPVEIRLPSQRDNKERRFFYADFADDVTAFFVKEKLAGHIVDGNQIQADISNPTLKKPRDTIPSSRQVHLHNLNFKKTDETALNSYFSRFGEVINVHLPLSEANKERNFINNGFAFISFLSDSAAAEALASKTAEIHNRTINISAVKSKVSSETKPSAFDDQRSITLQNVNEKVTEAQLRKFIETQVGTVGKISLRPSKKMALVEFQKPQDVGKAGFALEGTDYEDHILHVGPKKDFFQDEKAIKVPSMVPPMLMRRRKK